MKRAPRKGEGRPTKYNEEVIAKTNDYLNNSTMYGDVVPSIAGLVFILNVSRATIYEWKGVHPKFSDILDRLLAKQEQELLSNGLQSIFNPAITKLMLGKHGYKESTDITSDDKPLTPLLVRFLDDKTASNGDTQGV